ncbi:AtzH-like domain-containing protein [Cellulomonas sp. URHD0024]|uniref:AtzH-like domain-containing protein n=1 Tax=Cellulomonas sp. URHD0024 TaxID=1302620 RepID=UPI00040003D2|nr:AtzH-like domain-containing protein [Cellulomonas sp. URHD0024]
MTEPPAELRAAFEAYETAILDDDVAVLDDSFAPGPTTLRGDTDGLLVGHDAISAFRRGRGGVGPRTLDRVETRKLAEDCWLIVATSRYAGGGTGLQTQVWQLADGRWRITAAHVTGRTQSFDRSTWRTVGDPLYQGAFEGPLVGMRVAVKDLFAISGYRIGAGNPTWLREAHRERHHAPVVLDLLRGGASIRGLARTDELAYSIAGDNAHYGTPVNGAVVGALPGGSSSGPATAVATGQADVGLASDTAGSIRVPASYQGLWGLRTTHGLVPRQGMLPLAPSFDTVGWLTRDGATLEAVASWCLETAVDESVPDAHALPDLLRVPREALAGSEPATRAAFEAWCARREVELVDVGPLDGWYEAFRVVQAAEAWRTHGQWITEHPDAVGPGVRARFEVAATVTADQEAQGRERLARYAEVVRSLVADAVLALPSAPGPAPARGPMADDVRAGTLRMTALAGIGGLPALSVPALRVEGPLGLAPVGVCLVGPRGSDLSLVRHARRLTSGELA